LLIGLAIFLFHWRKAEEPRAPAAASPYAGGGWGQVASPPGAGQPGVPPASPPAAPPSGYPPAAPPPQ